MIRRTSITDFREAESDLGGEEEESPSLADQIAESAISRLSEKMEKEWVSDPTEQAPNRWTDTETGEHRYQEEKPGDGGESEEEEGGDGEGSEVDMDWEEPPEAREELESGQDVRLVNSETGEEIVGEVDFAAEDLASVWSESGEPVDVADHNEWEVEAVLPPDAEGGESVDYESDSLSEIVESIPYRGKGDKEDRVRETIDETVSRARSEDVARRTLAQIDQIETDMAGAHVNFAAGSDKEQAALSLGTGSGHSSITHEVGHLVADSFGYGISTDVAKHTMDQYEPSEDNFVEIPDENHEEAKLRELEEAEGGEDVDQLVDDVNEAWERMQEAGEDGAEEYIFEDNYSATNAHEAFAQFHETMQSRTFPSNTDVNWFYQDTHPGLLPSYLEVFEPSDKMKELLSHLHGEYTEESPFDEDPYPGIGKDGMTSGGGSGSATYGGARDDAHPDDEEEDEQYQKEAESGREYVDRVDEAPEDAVVQYEEDEGLFFEKGDLEYVGDEDDVELDDEGEVEIPKNCRLCDNIRIAEQMVCPEHAEWIDDPEEEEYTLATEVEEAHEKAWIQLEAKRRDSLEKSEGFEKIDDELMKFYTHIVWWGGKSPDLEKSPDMWRSSDEVPEFVETYIMEAVQDGAFWQGELQNLPAGSEQHVQELFEEMMTQPQGWSLGSIVDNMQDLFPQADEDYLLTVTRNEVASLANKAREEAYTDHDDSEEFLFYWSGPEDFNTTDICSEMKDRTNPRFGGEPKPLEEMRDTLEEIARGDDDGLPERISEWLPHFECRHTFVRKVYL